MKKNTRLLLLPALAITLLDQVSKLILVRTIHIHESVPVIHGLFNLVHVRNRGMAFGMMNRPGHGFVFYLLIAATVGAVVLLILWFRKLKDDEHKIILGLSLILGGAVGNLIDRIRLGEVIDFLDFYVGPHHWPSFNVADSAITVGVLWLAINMLFRKPSRE